MSTGAPRKGVFGLLALLNRARRKVDFEEVKRVADRVDGEMTPLDTSRAPRERREPATVGASAADSRRP